MFRYQIIRGTTARPITSYHANPHEALCKHLTEEIRDWRDDQRTAGITFIDGSDMDSLQVIQLATGTSRTGNHCETALIVSALITGLVMIEVQP